MEVAVKKIKVKQQKRRKIDTFMREVRALTRINHPNVIKLYGIGSYEDFVFSVMELCPNG